MKQWDTGQQSRQCWCDPSTHATRSERTSIAAGRTLYCTERSLSWTAETLPEARGQQPNLLCRNLLSPLLLSEIKSYQTSILFQQISGILIQEDDMSSFMLIMTFGKN
ncbi:hypothetical protein Mapa_014635 [Marchantia paleacea]|nr:hypothetical protein Mapa_014635 [Marchantia paleacea]